MATAADALRRWTRAPSARWEPPLARFEMGRSASATPSEPLVSRHRASLAVGAALAMPPPRSEPPGRVSAGSTRRRGHEGTRSGRRRRAAEGRRSGWRRRRKRLAEGPRRWRRAERRRKRRRRCTAGGRWLKQPCTREPCSPTAAPIHARAAGEAIRSLHPPLPQFRSRNPWPPPAAWGPAPSPGCPRQPGHAHRRRRGGNRGRGALLGRAASDTNPTNGGENVLLTGLANKLCTDCVTLDPK